MYKIKYSRFIPFKGFVAMALFGVIWIRKEYKHFMIDNITINHESIHLAQQKELGNFWFIILYLIEYFTGWIKYHNHYEAYRNIIFEREAYLNEKDAFYLKTRKEFDFELFNDDVYEYKSTR